MPPAKKSGSRKSTTRAKKSGSRRSTTRASAKESSAMRKLNKSLDSAQDALASLGKEVGKDVGGGARDLHKSLQGFVKDARRDSGKLGTALQRDVERLQKRVARSSPTRGATRAGGRKASVRSSAKKTTARRRPASSAKKTTARRRSASRSASR